ncbi:MAG TPA: protein kinase, partial [Kofleriaceae bacterium]|nr:protein kinase [Kofleriaceae bacterium]
DRFNREVLLARRVTHRNVCRVFDVGHHGDTVFLTMELIAGETLAERIRRDGAMRVPEAAGVVEQIVAGLAAAHRAGVVHRDLKCSNVMLAADRVVVTDFGLAYDATLDEHEASHDGFVGSPAYVAPEQVNGLHVGFAADIYALGVVLFEMVTGRLPFVGATAMATAMLRLEEEPPSPRAFAPELPRAWERTILRCLERDPGDRFASVEDVLASLQDRPVARPRGRRVHAAGAAVAALLVSSTALWWVLHERPDESVRGGPRTLAVLDLDDRTGDAAEHWRGAAFAEVLSTELGGTAVVHQLPRRVVEHVPIDQLARQGATHAVTGSVRRAGGDLVFEVRVVDLRTGALVSRVEQKGPPTALFDLASRSAAQLRSTLGMPALAAADAPRATLPTNPDAARLYTDGLAALRSFQPAAAEKAFDAALAIEPGQPVVYSALASAWHDLEADQPQREAARKAFELSANLPREQRLAIEATYREAIGDWQAALALRQSLATFFPENLDYGLALAEAQRRTGSPDAALATLAKLRDLPAPDGGDPRIDLAEGGIRASSDPAAARTAAQHAIDGAHERGLIGVEAEGHIIQCSLDATTGDVDAAKTDCGDAERLFTEQGNKDGVAKATVTLAQAYVATRRHDEAQVEAQKAQALYREIGSKTGEIRVKSLLAITYSRTGDDETASKLWRECVEGYREAGEPALMINAMSSVANMLTDTGHPAEAVPTYRDIIEKAHAQGLVAIEANTSSNLSIALTRLGQLDEARTFAEDAVALWTKVGQRVNVVYGLDSVEQIALRQGRVADAEKAEEEALALRESLGQIGGPSRQNLGEIAMVKGDLPRAIALAREAVDEFGKDKDPSGQAEASEILVSALVKSDRIDEAVAASAKQDEWVKISNEPTKFFVGSHALLKAARGDVQGAVADLRAAIAAAIRDGDIDWMMDQREILAQILVKHEPASAAAREAVATLRKEASERGYGQAEHDAAAMAKQLR